MSTPASPPWSRRHVARALILLLAGGLMHYGPFLWQARSAKKTHPVGWEWKLFRHRGVDVCDLRYWRTTDAGVERVDRRALLGHANKWSMPRAIRRVKRKEVRKHDTLVCDAAREAWGPDVVLDRDARCASDTRWVVLGERSPVCGPGLDLRRPKPKKSGRVGRNKTTRGGTQ